MPKRTRSPTTPVTHRAAKPPSYLNVTIDTTPYERVMTADEIIADRLDTAVSSENMAREMYNAMRDTDTYPHLSTDIPLVDESGYSPRVVETYIVGPAHNLRAQEVEVSPAGYISTPDVPIRGDRPPPGTSIYNMPPRPGVSTVPPRKPGTSITPYKPPGLPAKVEYGRFPYPGSRPIVPWRPRPIVPVPLPVRPKMLPVPNRTQPLGPRRPEPPVEYDPPQYPEDFEQPRPEDEPDDPRLDDVEQRRGQGYAKPTTQASRPIDGPGVAAVCPPGFEWDGHSCVRIYTSTV
jgi:hypothetical protein